MTDIDLDALEALEKAATPGPWRISRNSTGYCCEDDTPGMRPNMERVDIAGPDVNCHEDEVDPVDMALVVAARNALPELLRRARLLDEAVKLLRMWDNDARFDSHANCDGYVGSPDLCGTCESLQAFLARIDAEVKP